MSKSMLGQVMGSATAMALALLGVAAQAEAEVISVNGLNRDLATNLDWLNPTAS